MLPKLYKLQILIDFSFHSLFQAYGHTFMRRVVLRHPLRTLHGLWAYYQTWNAATAEERCLFHGGEQAFIQRAANDKERLLVGTGFCQKPLRAAGNAYDCPSGRFTHDCLYLSKLGTAGGMPIHPACVDCSIRVLGCAALSARASFAVLTSALDIAHDILLPALEKQRFTRVILAICPYSIEPMSMALLICGMEGYLLPYYAGSCVSYQQWLRADRGDKTERTALSPQSMSKLLKMLGAIGQSNERQPRPRLACYEQKGNLFLPRYEY